MFTKCPNFFGHTARKARVSQFLILRGTTFAFIFSSTYSERTAYAPNLKDHSPVFIGAQVPNR